ncbi:helix-turn-helix domain-containing protein [Kitasatospora sp. NPDC004799]|uniref:helix-turn-helix domain-containing protein n=1 Tax=Kitasatospora sp. NPDC004799 TaxID=3154460 RepID=UPI00339E0D58
MGRREVPLDPERGVTERFAAELRAVRIGAGEPTYRQLAKATHYSAATLARAASGNTLPTLDVTLAYVSACGVRDAELAGWRRRWEAARHESDSRAARSAPAVEVEADPPTEPLPADSGDSAEARTEIGSPVDPEAGGAEGTPEEAAQELGEPTEPVVPAERAAPRRPAVLAVAARLLVGLSLAANCALFYLLVATGSHPVERTAGRAGPDAAPASGGVSAAPTPSVQDGTDPKPHGCAEDAGNLDQAPVVLPQETVIDGRLQPAGTALGTVSLRYSARCAAAWSRFDPAEQIFSQPNQGTVTTRTLRTNDGTYTQFHLGHVDQSYSDLLLTGMGCIEARATVLVANGTVAAEGSTRCLPKL